MIPLVAVLVTLVARFFLLFNWDVFGLRKAGLQRIRGKRVLVTGGNSGIGKLLVERFRRAGCEVLVWDVTGSGDEKVDISNREQVYAKATALGRIDILVNNAGIVEGKTFLASSDDACVRVMNVNTLAHFWTTRAFLPQMLARNEGSIVTIASAAAMTGVVGLAPYCASKAAAFGFAESIRFELRKQRSKVHSLIVNPYYVNTGMFHGVRTRFPWLLPILEPEYVADQIFDAVLTGKEVLNMPWFINVAPLLRLLPTPVMDWVADFLGTNSSMEEFKGRQKVQ
jgi:all-trans-retinol dehydrogenase (NAD+)